MQLIKKIEVNYFRSLYTCTIKRCGDLNIIFGRNDSGKSNFLRALNLFFNDQTDLHTDLDFGIDLSDGRKLIARETKGKQFIWVKITFNVPLNYQKQLGAEISVKRQWNRDGDVNQTESPKLKTSGQSARLSRFLNDVDFTYVPAIKDLEVYADLVERMYASAAETKEIVSATHDFITRIGEQSLALTNGLEGLLGSKTSLSAPSDMSSLFRNLDFSLGDDAHSLFKQKGDGIKARHIPEILKFVNERDPRKKLYIWGIEEPENSLDLSAAGNEASRFRDISKSEDTQIFITSHSPAFYLVADGQDHLTRRTFITQQKLLNGSIQPEDAAGEIDDLDDADFAMATAGLMELPYVIRNLKGLRDSADKAVLMAKELQEKINDSKKPKLFLEGKHDKLFFTDAINLCVPGADFSVSLFGGTPSTTSAFLTKLISEGGVNAQSKTMMVFDNDNSGRSSYKALTGNQYEESDEPFEIAENVFVNCLPSRQDEFLSFCDMAGLKPKESIFEAEFLLDPWRSSKLLDELMDPDADERNFVHEDYFKKQQSVVLKLQSFEVGSPSWMYARCVPDRLKAKFMKDSDTSLDANPLLRQMTEQICNKLFT